MARNIFLTSNLCKHLFKQKAKVGFRTMSTENDVLFETVENAGVITLNRPKSLNTLNVSMIDKLLSKLKQWDKEKNLVIIKGAEGGKAFCAGADVRAIVESSLQDGIYAQDMANRVAAITLAVAEYKTPYVALIDGIVMGGGVGLSVHGPYRVATERTIYSMPETTIGFFPNVGGSYFLPRLQGKLGLYLALLSYHLIGSDVLKAGIATHYVESKNLKELEKSLVQCKNAQDINGVLNKFSVTDTKDFTLKPYLDKINKCFDASTVEEIIENLKKDGSSWAQKSLRILNKMCPTSLKITLKELELGSRMNLLECLRMEHRIAYHCVTNKNFHEGVRAQLVDKDQNPKWVPPTLTEVTEKTVDSYFAKLSSENELKCKL